MRSCEHSCGHVSCAARDTLYKHLTLYTPRYTLCTTPSGLGHSLGRLWHQPLAVDCPVVAKGPEVVVAFSTGEG